MEKKVLAVLTGKSEATIREVGGSGDWAVRPGAVRDVDYVICVRHAYPTFDPGPGPRPEAHGEAFLVGKVADLKFSYHKNGRDRFVIMFSEIAKVSSATGFWDGSRVPTRYMDEEDVKKRGIDFDALDFEPAAGGGSNDEVGDEEETAEAAPLTILAAKQGLAATFHVPISDIEIIIRG